MALGFIGVTGMDNSILNSTDINLLQFSFRLSFVLLKEIFFMYLGDKVDYLFFNLSEPEREKMILQVYT